MNVDDGNGEAQPTLCADIATHIHFRIMDVTYRFTRALPCQMLQICSSSAGCT